MERSSPRVEADSTLALNALARVAAESAATTIAVLWTLDDAGVHPRAFVGVDEAAACALLRGPMSEVSALEVSLPTESGVAGAICVFDRNPKRLYSAEHIAALTRVARAAGALLAEDAMGSGRYAVLREATAFAGVGVSVFSIGPNDATPLCEYVNDGSRARMGLTYAEFLRDTSAFYALGANAEALRRILDRARRADSAPFEAQLTAGNGTTYWTEISVRKLSHGDEQPLRYMVIAREITERKLAQEQGRLLAAAIEEQPAGVLIVDMHAEHRLRPPIIYANAGFCALTGYRLDEIRAGVYPVFFGDATDRDLVRDAADRVFAGEHVTVEVQLHRRDGTPFWAEVRAHALETHCAHAVMIINEIEERRAKDDWMRMLTEAIDQASDFVTIFDDGANEDGAPCLRYANRAFYEATQYEPEELIGRPYTAFYSARNDPVVLEAIRKSIDAQTTNYREVLVQRKDGSEFWIEFVGKPVLESNGRVARMSIGRDITLRRRAASQLSLLFSAFEQSPNRVILYEANEHDDLEIAYENEASSSHGHRRLLELWNDERPSARAVRRSLLAGERVHLVFAERGANGAPNVVDFVALSVRNASRLEAILTVDRMIGDTNVAEAHHSRLLELATLLHAFREARDPAMHLHVLRALLLSAFGAEIGVTTAPAPSGVQIDAAARHAAFGLGGRSYVVSWTGPLEERDLTGLRFCIEACIEHEHASRTSAS